jgi:outer membrane protein W
MRKIVLLSALVLLVGASAFAEGPPIYAALKLGGFFPQNVDVNGAGDLDMDSAFYGELALGHYFNPNFAIELGVGYTKPNKSVSFTDNTGTYSADVDLTIIPVTLGVIGRLPMGNFEPYAMAGIGAYFTELETAVSVPGLGISGSESETAFGWYLGLGGNFNITKEFYLGVEGKYSWLYPSFSGLDVDVDGISVTANIGYRF